MQLRRVSERLTLQGPAQRQKVERAGGDGPKGLVLFFHRRENEISSIPKYAPQKPKSQTRTGRQGSKGHRKGLCVNDQPLMVPELWIHPSLLPSHSSRPCPYPALYAGRMSPQKSGPLPKGAQSARAELDAGPAHSCHSQLPCSK